MSGSLPVRSAVVLWSVAAPLLALSLHRPFGPSQGRAASLPTAVEGYVQEHNYELTPRQLELLGTDDATWRAYRDGAGELVYLVAVFHQENWKSVHPPDICLRGSGMDIRAAGTAAIPGAPPLQAARILAVQRQDHRSYLSLYVYGADDLTTPSYREFVLHHAPAALLRQPIRGYLLRVETFVGEDGVAAAERRCGLLLRRVLPRVRGALAGKEE